MTEQKHTPGPWVAIRNSAFWEIIPRDRSPDDPYTIGDVCASDPSSPDRGLQEANARLIAAAPDLLEALRMLRGQYVLFVGPDDDIATAVLSEVDAAIAKTEDDE